MTIDLGFAWFAGAGGEPVGVIDVPGHERFIRNMVAGAWSLDCALLLVAADDGWMQQTQDHAVVLASLGVPAVILVVTKTDIASGERVQEVRRDAERRCGAIFGRNLPAIEVSALARRNVDALKELIVATLAGVPERPRPFPYLYVDRVFSIKGAGLVITGSLRGASLGRDDPLVLLPQRETLRVRAIQTYNAAVDRAEPTCRVALNLVKPKAEVRPRKPRHVARRPFQCPREFIARVRPAGGNEPAIKEPCRGRGGARDRARDRTGPFPRRPPVRALPAAEPPAGHSGTSPSSSSAMGAAPSSAAASSCGSGRSRGRNAGASLPCSRTCRIPPARRIGCPSSSAFAGSRVASAVGGPTTGWPGRRDGPPRRVDLPRVVAREDLEGHRRPRRAAGRTVRARARREAARRCRRSPGSAGFAGGTEDAVGARHAVLRRGRGRRGPAACRGAPPRGHPREGPHGLGGIAPRAEHPCSSRQGRPARGRDLLREGNLRPARRRTPRRPRQAGDRFGVPEAKERTGLSRKYTLPILNRMEKDGLLRREQDARVVR